MIVEEFGTGKSNITNEIQIHKYHSQSIVQKQTPNKSSIQHSSSSCSSRTTARISHGDDDVQICTYALYTIYICRYSVHTAAVYRYLVFYCIYLFLFIWTTYSMHTIHIVCIYVMSISYMVTSKMVRDLEFGNHSK